MMSARGKTGHRKDSADWDSEGEPIAETPRRVRQKGPSRYALNLAPEPEYRWEPPFSTADVEYLIKKVNCPLVESQSVGLVTKRLNFQARCHEYWAQLDRQPTDRMLIKFMKKLARSARALQAMIPLLPIPGDHSLEGPNTSPAYGIVWPLRLHLPETVADRRSQGREKSIRTPQPGEIWILKEDASETMQQIGANISRNVLRDLSEGSGALADACDLAVQDAEQRFLQIGGAAKSETATTLRYTVQELLSLYAEFFGRKATIWKECVRSRPSGPALRFVQGALQVMGVETSDENILRIYRQESKRSKSGDGSAG